ncbi:MAG: hypothetical protein IIA02_12290 [Proteobacteria bacterium]|uniref:hypothetical protein n=1 Tax=Aquabacterium sp. TaxID=1872578 RepID=UPI0035C7792F|nr:hypothetical protein [Pseudomonadota bacterium]
MRKKLLQHTLLAAIAAWAMHLAQDQTAADSAWAAAPQAQPTQPSAWASQSWALR